MTLHLWYNDWKWSELKTSYFTLRHHIRCTGVNFALDFDRKGEFRFAALQSEAGKALLQKSGRRADDISSIVLVDEDGAYVKSTAVLRIARKLGSIFPILVGSAFSRIALTSLCVLTPYTYFCCCCNVATGPCWINIAEVWARCNIRPSCQKSIWLVWSKFFVPCIRRWISSAFHFWLDF